MSSVAPLDEPLEGEAGPQRARGIDWAIRGPLDRRRYVLIAMASFALGLASWWAVSALALVDPLFLPGPAAVLRRFVTWLGEGTLAADAGISVFRVTAGFLLSAVMAVPLSLLIGSYRPVRAFFEPLLEFSRYLPAVAFVPLVLLWVGIGEASKILVIWIGTFFQMVIMLSEDVGRVPRRNRSRRLARWARRDREIIVGVLLRSAHAGDVRHLAHHARMGVDLSRGRRAGRRQLRSRLCDPQGAALPADRPHIRRHHPHWVDRSRDRPSTALRASPVVSLGRHPFPMSPKLTVKALGKRFDPGGLTALADVTFSMAAGEFVALVGASGCGKSTLLRIIGGPGACDQRRGLGG